MRTNGSGAGGGPRRRAVDWDQPITANDDTPSTGIEPAESIDHELQTDVEVSRRRFPDATAAAATLPAASSPAAADGDSDTEQDDETVETPT